MSFAKHIHKTIIINAPVSKVWVAITDPKVMKQWYSDSELTIRSEMKVGTPFLISGIWHGTAFENKGFILQFEPLKRFSYSHFSSMSEIPDLPENYSILDFRLQEKDGNTVLTFNCTNLIDDAIYGHMNFYWSVTLELLKRFLEGS